MSVLASGVTGDQKWTVLRLGDELSIVAYGGTFHRDVPISCLEMMIAALIEARYVMHRELEKKERP